MKWYFPVHTRHDREQWQSSSLYGQRKHWRPISWQRHTARQLCTAAKRPLWGPSDWTTVKLCIKMVRVSSKNFEDNRLTQKKNAGYYGWYICNKWYPRSGILSSLLEWNAKSYYLQPTRVLYNVMAAAESVKKAMTPDTVLSSVVWKTVNPNELIINEVWLLIPLPISWQSACEANSHVLGSLIASMNLWRKGQQLRNWSKVDFSLMLFEMLILNARIILLYPQDCLSPFLMCEECRMKWAIRKEQPHKNAENDGQYTSNHYQSQISSSFSICQVKYMYPSAISKGERTRS